MNLTNVLKQKTVPVFSLIISLVVLVTFLAYWWMISLQSASIQDEELDDLIEEDKSKTWSWFAVITGVVSLFGIGFFIAHLISQSLPVISLFNHYGYAYIFSSSPDGKEKYEKKLSEAGNVDVANVWECVKTGPAKKMAGDKLLWVQTGPSARPLRPCIEITDDSSLYKLVLLKRDRIGFEKGVENVNILECSSKHGGETKLEENKVLVHKPLIVQFPDASEKTLFCFPFWEMGLDPIDDEVGPDDRMMIVIYRWLYANERKAIGGSNFYLTKVADGGADPPKFKINKLPFFMHHENGQPVSEEEAQAFDPVLSTFVRLDDIIYDMEKTF